MNHIVCIAYVPDTESKIKVAGDGLSIDEASGVLYVIDMGNLVVCWVNMSTGKVVIVVM